MIKVTKKPEFKKTFRFLEKIDRYDPRPILERHGAMGVSKLAAATPVDSGATASGWSYKIKGNKDRYKLIWTNDQVAGTAPLILLLQYGHATKSGFFLSGRDIINPALLPVYDSLHEALVKEALK